MKIANVAIVVGCLAFAALPFQASAQDDDDEADDSHPLTNMPLSANFVTVAYRFHDEPSEGLIMGERVDVVVGVINTHPTKEINVTSAMGSLNHPSDFSIHVYNFSQQLYGANNVPVTIPPGQECSFTYNFYTPNVLQVDYPYQLALTLFYEDDVRHVPLASRFLCWVSRGTMIVQATLKRLRIAFT